MFGDIFEVFEFICHLVPAFTASYSVALARCFNIVTATLLTAAAWMYDSDEKEKYRQGPVGPPQPPGRYTCGIVMTQS